MVGSTLSPRIAWGRSAALRVRWRWGGKTICSPAPTAAVVLVIAAMFERTTGKYGGRGERFVHMEAGHAGQNVCLQAAALGLGTTVVGAFDDKAVKAIIGVDQPGEPLCLLPVGRR